MQREAFLDRVRQAALAGQAHRVHSRDIPREAGYVGVAQDKCAALAREIDAVGGLASLVDGMEAARTVITGLLSDYRARSALCWQHRLLEQLRLDELLQQANITKQDFNSLSVRIAHLRRPEATAAGEDARATSRPGQLWCWRGDNFRAPGVKRPGRQGKRPGACAIGKD